MIGTIKFWGGILLSVLLLIVFVLTVDLDRMMVALADANYWFLIPGISLYFIAVLFRTIRWQLLLRHVKPVKLTRLYPVVVVGYMANNLLPMRLGELVRSYYVSERESLSKTVALTTIFVERILDALILLFLIAIAALFIPLDELAKAFGDQAGIATSVLVLGFTLPFLGAFSFQLLFAFYPDRTRTLALMVANSLPNRFEDPILRLVDSFLQGLEPLRNPLTLTSLLLLSLPLWLFEVGLFIFVGYSFGLDNNAGGLGNLVIVMVVITAIANIGSSIPATPGGIGLFELLARESLIILPLAAVDRSVAGGFAAVVHASLLIPMILMGQLFLWREQLSLRRLSSIGKNELEGVSQKKSMKSLPGLSIEEDEGVQL